MNAAKTSRLRFCDDMVHRIHSVASHWESIEFAVCGGGRRHDAISVLPIHDIRTVFQGRVRYAPCSHNAPVGDDGWRWLYDEQDCGEDEE